MCSSTLSRPEILLQAELFAVLLNDYNLESSPENIENGRVDNLRLFADEKCQPTCASRILSLTERYLTPPAFRYQYSTIADATNCSTAA